MPPLCHTPSKEFLNYQSSQQSRCEQQEDKTVFRSLMLSTPFKPVEFPGARSPQKSTHPIVVQHDARWVCVENGRKAGASLGSHKKYVPWSQSPHSSPHHSFWACGRFGVSPGPTGRTSCGPACNMAAQATPSGHMGMSAVGAPFVHVHVMWVAVEGCRCCGNRLRPLLQVLEREELSVHIALRHEPDHLDQGIT